MPNAFSFLAATHWVHDLDPFLIQFSDNFGIRYYGLAYVLAFVTALWLLAFYRRKGRSSLTPDQESNLFTALILGVMIGGRLGYMFLYNLPEFLANPLVFIRVWEGGMASHGGFAGVFIAALWFCRREKIRLFQLGDVLCTLAPPGLMLGRIANFINGELWGKPSDVPWAVIFPQCALQGAPVVPRHPSQLYEAALEGLLLIVFTQWRFWKTSATRHEGRLTGEFFLLYAVVRMVGEQFREPDASLILGMSRGTFYSIFFAAVGIGLILWSRYHPVTGTVGDSQSDGEMLDEKKLAGRCKS